MKIQNHTNLDEEIKRSADMDILHQEMQKEIEMDAEEEFSEEEWQNWLASMGWN